MPASGRRGFICGETEDIRRDRNTRPRRGHRGRRETDRCGNDGDGLEAPMKSGNLSIGGGVSQAIAGGVGGAILTAIIGAIKNRAAA